MTSGDHGAESSSNDEGSAELLRRIRAGDTFAIQEFRSRFSAGIEFLLRRKLGKAEASGEVASVIEAAVRAIQASPSGEAVSLPHLIVSLIHLQFAPSAGDVSSSPSGFFCRKDSEICNSGNVSGRTGCLAAILRTKRLAGSYPEAVAPQFTSDKRDCVQSAFAVPAQGGLSLDDTRFLIHTRDNRSDRRECLAVISDAQSVDRHV